MFRGDLCGPKGKERPRTVYLGPLLCPTGRGEGYYIPPRRNKEVEIGRTVAKSRF